MTFREIHFCAKALTSSLLVLVEDADEEPEVGADGSKKNLLIQVRNLSVLEGRGKKKSGGDGREKMKIHLQKS